MRRNPPAIVACLAGAMMAACSAKPSTETGIEHYFCDDGSAFSVEVMDAYARIFGPTGTVDVPRDRDSEELLYTNNLRTLVILEAGVRVRYTIGRRAWTECSIRE